MNPYVGPRSLRYGEHIYGRDREARQLLELLIAERIVLLYSPSGAGKTSLIQAALIPELEAEEFHVLPVIRVGRGTADEAYPCNPYVMSALLSLEQGVAAEDAIPVAELAAMQLSEYLQRREAREDSGDGTFLIFDQFEEILTIDPMNREAKMDFFNQVGEALRDLKRWALFAMREDHVAALDSYLRPIPTRLKSTFRLDLLNADAGRIAVQRPAKECGVEFTEGATTKLVDDLREVAVQSPTGATEMQLGPYIEPVQLQVVCYRLWEKLPEGVKEITEAQVVGTGDVDSALADYYAERVSQIAGKCGVKERVLREWFDRRLITESGIRSQVMVGSENSREICEAAIQELVNVHLIRGEERRGVTWLELAHDRLVKPIRANNAAWWERNLSVLQHQAAVWNNQGRSDALCLRGDARKEAQRWADEHDDELTQTEREFLEGCQRNHDARKNKWALWAAAVLGIVLTGISVLALWAWRQKEDAVRERQDADTARQMAVEQRKMAEDERNIANARSMAARAMQLRDDRLDISMLLATEAYRLRDQPDTRGALLTTAYHNPRLTTYLHGSMSQIGAVAFSHDGTRLATGDYKGNVALWDAATHQVVERLPAFVGDAVRTIAFSADEHYMAVSSKARQLVLRDLRTRELKPFPAKNAHTGDVWSVAFTDDSAFLVSGDSKGQINLWEIATDDVQVLLPSGSGVRGVAFDPAGMQLAAGCNDGRILLWRREAGAWISVKRDFSIDHPNDPETDPKRREENVNVDAHLSHVRCLAISADGRYIAVGRRSGAADLYDLSGPGERLNVAAFGRHDGPVSSLAFSPGTTGVPPDFTRLVTAGFDGTVQLWKVPSMEPVGPPMTGHVGRVLSVAFCADKKSVVSGGADRRAILWDTWIHVGQTGRAESTGTSFSLAFSPDGVFEGSGFPDGSVLLAKHDLENWDAILVPVKIPPVVPGCPIITFSGDSRRMVASAGEGMLCVYDVTKSDARGLPSIVGKIPVASAKKFHAICLSRDGEKVAAAFSSEGVEDARILVWNVATGEPLFPAPLTNPADSVTFAIEFSPDGKRLVTGGDGERAVIWTLDGNTSKPLECPEEHTGSIRTLAFSPDGKMFATASGDNTLIIWETDAPERHSPPLAGHHAPVVVAAFSPDGRLLASGSDDNSVILWDVRTKQPTGRLTGHTDSVRALAFSAGSRQLVTGSWSGEGLRWELDPAALEKKCHDRANRNLIPTEWSAYVGDGPIRKTWPTLPETDDQKVPSK